VRKAEVGDKEKLMAIKRLRKFVPP